MGPFIDVVEYVAVIDICHPGQGMGPALVAGDPGTGMFINCL